VIALTKRRVWFVAAVLAVACSVALLVALSEKAEATFPGKNGKIAFVSTRHGKTGGEDIYTMNPSGTAVHRLTNFSGSDFEPAWSPGGSKIAFMSYRHSGGSGSTYRLYTMNARGTGVEPLSSNPHDDHDPAWSPDGNRIAFVRDRHDKKLCPSLFSCDEIYTMNSNGQASERLTNNHTADFDPDWQPLSSPRQPPALQGER